MKNLLVVEDDPALLRSLCEGLAQDGYAVRTAGTAREALAALDAAPPDMMVLDLGLPDMDGLHLLQRLRANPRNVPVLILSARDGVEDRVAGLESGAVDYMTKPFAFPELLARIRLRLRSSSPAPTTLRIGSLAIDLLRRTVTLAGASIDLPPREYDLLVCLARAAGRAVSREELAREVWKSQRRMTSLDNLIDVHVSRLRERLDSPEAPRLRTVRGVGYQLEPAS